MQNVAHHLQKFAHNNPGPERDSFARSAYNRYYYACFLDMRTALIEMNSIWSDSRHKDYPEILEGKVKKRLKAARKQSEKLGDTEVVKQIDAALRAIPELCKIITDANATRVVADYQPTIPVVFSKVKRFSLNAIEVSTAHEWQGKIQTLIKSVLSAWKQSNA